MTIIMRMIQTMMMVRMMQMTMMMPLIKEARALCDNHNQGWLLNRSSCNCSRSRGKRSKQRSLFQSTIFQTIKHFHFFHFIWFSFPLILMFMERLYIWRWQVKTVEQRIISVHNAISFKWKMSWVFGTWALSNYLIRILRTIYGEILWLDTF